MYFSKFDPNLEQLFELDGVILTSRGRIVSCLREVADDAVVDVTFKLCGGKGGFGSLLRAIGSQIHNTTDRKSCRNLDGSRIRARETETDLINAKKRKIENDKLLAIKREEKEAKKMESMAKTAAGEHGGKHYYEDSEYVDRKERSTNLVSESVSFAATKLRKEAEERRKKEAEERRIKEQSAGDDSDSDCSSLEDEFMPIKTPVHTGPTKISANMKGGTTAGVKTTTHSNVMYSHLLGANIDEYKPAEMLNLKDTDLSTLESIDELMSESGERLVELLMLRGLKTSGTIPERADRLWQVRGLNSTQYPQELVVKR